LSWTKKRVYKNYTSCSRKTLSQNTASHQHMGRGFRDFDIEIITSRLRNRFDIGQPICQNLPNFKFAINYLSIRNYEKYYYRQYFLVFYYKCQGFSLQVDATSYWQRLNPDDAKVKS
jgi:hypothetical protein